MYEALIFRTIEEIDAVKRHVRTSEALRRTLLEGIPRCRQRPSCFDVQAFSDHPDSIQWRVIDYCSAMSRIYAIYEQFVHKIIRDYIIYVEDNVDFDQILPEMQKSYKTGFSRVIANIHRPRYSHLSLPTLVADYAGALSGKKKYRLEPEAFLAHDRNLRLGELNDLFVGCSIGGMTNWVQTHPRMINFFASEQRIASTVESELRNFVQGRNDAAHGALNVDGIEGTETLFEYADFISILCEVIAERVHKDILDTSREKSLAKDHGSVTELFNGKTVVIGNFVGTFEVGARVYISGENYCKEARILSIQLNGSDVDGVTAITPLEIGLKLSGRGRIGANLASAFPLVRQTQAIPQELEESGEQPAAESLEEMEPSQEED